MDDDDVDLRPATLTAGRLKLLGAIVLGALLLFVGLPRFLDWREHRERVARDEAEAPFRAEQATLEHQLAERFAPIAVTAAAGAVAPETCPAEVTGPVPLVQRERLAYALSRGGAYPGGELLSSPAFLYWMGATTPAAGDTKQLAVKSQAYRDLLAAKFVAIFTTAEASAIKTTGESTFEGGGLAGDLVVFDVARHAAVCRAAIRVQPSFVIAVKQDSAEGDRWAMGRAQSDAISDAFWTGVQAQLAQMAPGAQVVKK